VFAGKGPTAGGAIFAHFHLFSFSRMWAKKVAQFPGTAYNNPNLSTYRSTIMRSDLLQYRAVRWGLCFGFWTCLGLFNVTQGYVQRYQTGEPIVWSEILVTAFVDWWLWAALTPLLLYLARRFPLEPPAWRRHLLVHAAVSAAAALVMAASVAAALNLAGCADYRAKSYPNLFRMLLLGPNLLPFLWVYWAVIGVAHAWRYHEKYRERELQAAELKGQLAQSQLQLLKMQLQPHFLFNTLHTISALMHKDVELADEMMVQFADLLRITLDDAQAHEVPLRQELEFVTTYLKIEQARLGSRLNVRLDIDPQTRDALVPNLLLQPLVENAIRHGIAPRVQGGRLVIRAHRTGALLEVRIEDDGPGLAGDFPARARTGLGLANTRARLQGLYGAAHQFDLSGRPEGGAVAALTIPFRREADEAAAPGANGAAVLLSKAVS
jgi:signal transduction histidine kinase